MEVMRDSSLEVVVCTDNNCIEKAEYIARLLNADVIDAHLLSDPNGTVSNKTINSVPHIDEKIHSIAEDSLYLKVGRDGVSLCKEGMEMLADLTHMIKRLKRNNLSSELLVRAAKFSDKCNTAFDATAGMAEDSLLLAAAGFDVTLYEKDPVIYILVKDALERAANVPELADAVSRMRLINGDSIEAMYDFAHDNSDSVNSCCHENVESKADNVSYRNSDSIIYNNSYSNKIENAIADDVSYENGVSIKDNNICQINGEKTENIKPPDIILLDPMFPERQKSGLVKKKFQLIHNLECPCNDEKEMLDAAMAVKPQKIIIKRPLKGPYLAGIKPSYSLYGKSIRYDCIINIK